MKIINYVRQYGLLEFLFMVTYRLRLIINGFPIWLSVNKCSGIPRIDSLSFIIGRKYINIGVNFMAGKGLRLQVIDRHRSQQFNPVVRIGNNVNINDYVHIACCDEIIIGNNVLMAGKVFITDHSHGNYKVEMGNNTQAPIDRDLITQKVRIGNNVWIGENVVILMGVVIGDNCVIGANAVVKSSMPAGSIVAGVPAKIIGSV